MFLTGYHGTSADNATKILDGEFNISSTDVNWLGDGIYFYPEFSDAYEWGPQMGRPEPEAIIHVIVKVDDNCFLNMDSREGEEIISGIVNIISKTSSKTISAQKNQCAIMRLIWDMCPEVQVIMAKFPKNPKPFPMVMDLRRYRKEFCLRSNELIRHKGIIERGEVS